MDLKEFGKLLKEERLRQGLEIADVMEKTKISRMNLVAIEEGNEQALPHPVYAKGFVKNYARFLGMDADKMGNTLARIYVSQEELDSDDMVQVDAEKLPAVRREGFPKLLGLAAALVVLLVLVVGVWVFHGSIFGLFSGSTAEEVAPPPSVTGQPGEETDLGLGPQDDALMRELGVLPGSEPGTLAFPSLAEELETEALDDDGLPELQSSAPDVSVDVGAPPVRDEPAAVGEPETAEAETVPQTFVAEQTAVPAGTERLLEIRATENCWLSAQADDMRPREVFLRPGERFEISFKDFVVLRLGNAGGVSLYLDGQQWPLSARSGEVMTLRLP